MEQDSRIHALEKLAKPLVPVEAVAAVVPPVAQPPVVPPPVNPAAFVVPQMLQVGRPKQQHQTFKVLFKPI